MPIVREGGTVAVFRLDAGVAQSILPTVPWDASAASEAVTTVDLESLRRRLNVDVLWFPLLCEDAVGTRTLLAAAGVVVSRRRPSPVIDWTLDECSVWRRTCERLGSRAERQWRAFKRRDFCVHAIEDPEEAVRFVEHVERRSWKTSCQQDMISRRQFSLYAALIRDRVLNTVGATDKGQPVAYRLDGRAAETLFCVKWSYDEKYRNASPGFALLTRDLPERYRDSSLRRVDLFGGRDLLKELIMTGTRSRVDVAFPSGYLSGHLLQRGRELDAAIEANLRSGRGLRSLYASAQLEPAQR